MLFGCGTPKSTACALARSSSAWFSCSYSDSGAAQQGPAGAAAGSGCAQGHTARWHLPKRPRQGSAESQLPGCSFCPCNALTSSSVCKWGFLQTSGEEQLTANSSVAEMCVCVCVKYSLNERGKTSSYRTNANGVGFHLSLQHPLWKAFAFPQSQFAAYPSSKSRAREQRKACLQGVGWLAKSGES